MVKIQGKTDMKSRFLWKKRATTRRRLVYGMRIVADMGYNMYYTIMPPHFCLVLSSILYIGCIYELLLIWNTFSLFVYLAKEKLHVYANNMIYKYGCNSVAKHINLKCFVYFNFTLYYTDRISHSHL